MKKEKDKETLVHGKDPIAELMNGLGNLGLFAAIFFPVFIIAFIAMIPLIGAGIGLSMIFGPNEIPRKRR